MKNNKGFTLIELLVVIAVLSLVFSVTVYSVTSVIRAARERTYKVTMNEVESAAGNYSLENPDKILFLTDKNNAEYESQCIRVKELIEYGFLNSDVVKSKVSEDRYISLDDFIYISRNKKTGAVNQKQLVLDGTSYGSICEANVQLSGDIEATFNPNMVYWSRTKAALITYKYNVSGRDSSGYNNAHDIKYYYNYNNSLSGESESKSVSFDIEEPGSLYAFITDNGEKIAQGTWSVSKIDRLGPTIKLKDDSEQYKNVSVTIPLIIKDCNKEGTDCSGLNQEMLTNSGLDRIISDGWIMVKVGNAPIGSSDLRIRAGDSSNTYNLYIKNSTYDGNVIITIRENTFVDNVVDDEKNGNKNTVLNTNITFDNTPPNIEFKLLDDNRTPQNSIYYYDEDETEKNPSWFNFTPTLWFRVSDTGGSGVKKEVSGRINSPNKAFLSRTDMTTNTFKLLNDNTYSWKISDSGYRYVEFIAKDNADNSVTKRIHFKYDNEKPSCIITGLNNMRYESTLTATVNCSDNFTNITNKSLTVNDFVVDNTVEITEVNKTRNINNGYEYTIKLRTKKVGDFKVGIKANLFQDLAGNWNDSHTSSRYMVIKADGICPTITGYSGVYDGAYHKVSVSGNSSGTIQYATSSSGPWGSEIPTRKNVGTTTVYVKVLENDSYKGKTCGSREINITKADGICPTITGYSGVYDGANHKVSVSGSSSGTIEYATSSSGPWSTEKPSRKNVGTTMVYVRVLENDSYKGKTCGSETISITKANPVCPTLTGYTGTYDGSGHKITVTGGKGGTKQYRVNSSNEWSANNPHMINAGTMTVYVRVNGDDNYNTLNCGSSTVKINKADSVCPTLTGYTGTYDGDSHKITVTGGNGGMKQYRTSSSESWSYSQPTLTDVGEKTVYVQLENNINYNGKSCGSSKIKITKANSVCPTLSNYSGAYDGNSHSIGVSNNAVGGRVEYRTSTTGDWSTTKPTRTNVGTTTVYVRVLGDKNYSDAYCDSRTITITDSCVISNGEKPEITIPNFTMSEVGNSSSWITVKATFNSGQIRYISSAFYQTSPNSSTTTDNSPSPQGKNGTSSSVQKNCQCVTNVRNCRNPEYPYLLVCVTVRKKESCSTSVYCKWKKAGNSTLYNGHGY